LVRILVKSIEGRRSTRSTPVDSWPSQF